MGRGPVGGQMCTAGMTLEEERRRLPSPADAAACESRLLEEAPTSGDSVLTLSSSLRIDLREGVIWRDGTRIHLTPNEQAVLGVLLAAKGGVVSRRELNAHALGYHVATRSRALDATIQRLRKKVEVDPTTPVHLLSIYGQGYRFAREVKLPAPERKLPPAWLSTRFVGRDSELSALGQWLDERRAVALVGTSGVGKSRLAAEFIRRREGAGGGRQVWVDLSHVSRTSEALIAIASALGLAARRANTQELSKEIRKALEASDELVMVVDGAEEVVAELAPRMLLWLAVPTLRLILTARLRVGLEGWVVHTLQGLSDEQAVQLLRDRTDLAVSLEPALAGRLVGHLDGLPLAIEFAAARLRVVGIRSLLRALERGTRHHADNPTLLQAIDWALGTLSPAARAAVGGATVFREPFELESFAAVAMPDERDLLQVESVVIELLDCCLLKRESRDGEVYFSLYAAVRHRAAEQRTPESVARHAQWFAAQLETAPEVWAIDGDYMRSCRRRLQDVVAAWRWLIAAGRSEEAAVVALGLCPYLHHAGPVDLNLEVIGTTLPLVSDRVVRGRLYLAESAAHSANMDAPSARASLVRASVALGRHGRTRWHARLLHLIGKLEWRRKLGMSAWFHRASEVMAGAGDRAGEALVLADLVQRSLSRSLEGSSTSVDPQLVVMLGEARSRAQRARCALALLLVDWGQSYVYREGGRIDAARATLQAVRDRTIELGSIANAYAVELSLAYLAWWAHGDFVGLVRHIRAARSIAAGFQNTPLDYDLAAAQYEALLDERARPMLIDVLGRRAASVPESAVLLAEVRLVLLDAQEDSSLRSVERLARLRESAGGIQHEGLVTEITVAMALLLARSGRWALALEQVEQQVPPQADALSPRHELVRAVRAAVKLALGQDSRAEDTLRQVAAKGPGRLTNIACGFLEAAGVSPGLSAVPDHAPQGSVLPHEAALAAEVAASLRLALARRAAAE